MTLDEATYRLRERAGILFGDRELTAADKAELKTYREFEDWQKAKEQHGKAK